jgi:hypothetical protein
VDASSGGWFPLYIVEKNHELKREKVIVSHGGNLHEPLLVIHAIESLLDPEK